MKLLKFDVADKSCRKRHQFVINKESNHQTFDSLEKLVFTIDQVRGNCSIHSINPESGDYPASSVWPHPDGSISMHGPEYFWHIPSHARDQYYYKGNQY